MASKSGTTNRIISWLRCPQCHEQRTTHLVFKEDHERVECQTCGMVYHPNPAEQIARGANIAV
jgi:uncharacterized metal-binding protein (TIGR02443 family)